jgi:nitric oxide reductase activation protein
LRNYDTVYQVDIGQHLLSWELTVPSEDELLGLQTRLVFACTVEDPAAIVDRSVPDARQELEPVLLPLLKDASRRCRVDRCVEAEQTMLASLPNPLHARGFRLEHYMVTVAPDAAAREHLEERRKEEQQERRKREEAKEAARRKEDRRKEIRNDVEYYDGLLRRADASSVWALLLAQNPDAAEQLASQLSSKAEARQSKVYQILDSVLKRKELEDWQIEGALKVLWELLMRELSPERLVDAQPAMGSPPLSPEEPTTWDGPKDGHAGPAA